MSAARFSRSSDSHARPSPMHRQIFAFPSLARHPSPSRVMFMQADPCSSSTPSGTSSPHSPPTRACHRRRREMWQQCNADLPSYRHPPSTFDRQLRRRARPVLCQLHDSSQLMLITWEQAAVVIAEPSLWSARLCTGGATIPASPTSPSNSLTVSIHARGKGWLQRWTRRRQAPRAGNKGGSAAACSGGSRARSRDGIRRTGDERECEPVLQHHQVTKHTRMSQHASGRVHCTLRE